MSAVGNWVRRAQALSGRMLLVAAGLAIVVAWERLEYKVAVVEMAGELTAAERARATELVTRFLPTGMLELDVHAIRAALVAESWIDTASVRRRWPDALEIRIVQEVPMAHWRDQVLLSARGVVIQPLEPPEGAALPRLAGPPGSAEKTMKVFRMVSDVLRPLGIEISSLTQGPAGNVRVVTREGVEIVFGADRLSMRLQRLVKVLRGPLADGRRLVEVARLDTRYDNGVAVAWREQPVGAGVSTQPVLKKLQGG